MDQVLRENKDFRFDVAQLKEPSSWREDLSPHYRSQEAHLPGDFCKQTSGTEKRGLGLQSFDCLLRRVEGDTPSAGALLNSRTGKPLPGLSKPEERAWEDGGAASRDGRSHRSKPTHHHSPKQRGRASWGGLRHEPREVCLWSQGRAISFLPHLSIEVRACMCAQPLQS